MMTSMVEIKQKPQLHASWIDPHAREIVRTLQNEGFKAYLVGGCVRDLLAGFHPKDYDIATSAEPNQVKRKVSAAYVIGRRFRLVLVKRGLQQYEVATFRKEGPEDEGDENDSTTTLTGVVGDNHFGTEEEDALRRDFTINALFYDPVADQLIDYAHGMKDIESRVMRMIGDPATRIIEDPIRILRAVRLSHKLKFSIDPLLLAAIVEKKDELAKSVLPRRREEYLKFLRLPEPLAAFLELYDLGVLQVILPSLVPVYEDPARYDIFHSNLSRFRELVLDDSQTAQVYLAFIHAYVAAMEGHPQFQNLLGKLLRDELMIFKTEQAAVFGAFQLLDNFPATELYKRKGARRQKGFLLNESFMLSLRLAKFDHLISPAQWLFWNEEIRKNLV
jgi:poly(A) polymerase